MKRNRIVAFFLFFAFVGFARADFPLRWIIGDESTTSDFLSAKNIFLKNRSSFARKVRNSYFFPKEKETIVNSGSLRLKKTPVKGIELLLYCDFKLKVKLNRNMNIIFSYR
jgi:hypothetical protein